MLKFRKKEYRSHFSSREDKEIFNCCGMCGDSAKERAIEIEASTTGEHWWWEDYVCSEACLNLWILNRL